MIDTINIMENGTNDDLLNRYIIKLLININYPGKKYKLIYNTLTQK